MLNIDNIIFDLDGVIVETERGRFQLLSNLLKKYGIDLMAKYSLKDIAGVPTDIFLFNNFPFLGEATIAKIIKKRRKIFLNNLSEYCIPMHGIVSFLHYLMREKYNLILATTNEQYVGEKLLNFIGIYDCFSLKFYKDKLINNNTKQKDYSILIEIGIDPTVSIILEDSIVGVSSAKENGFFCVAFNKYEDEKIVSLADVIIESFDDLGPLLEKKHPTRRFT